MKLKKLSYLVALSSAALASGCTIVDQSYDQARSDMGSVKKSIEGDRSMKPSAVSDTDEIWLGGDPYKVGQEEAAPGILKRTVSVKQLDPISASDVMQMLSTDIGIKFVMTQDAIDYTNGVERSTTSAGDAGNGAKEGAGADGPGTPMNTQAGNFQSSEQSIFQAITGGAQEAGSRIKFTLDYKGSVAGLLDLVASKAGLFWKFENGEIVMRRFETRSFILDMSPGTVSYESEIKSDLSTNGSSDEGSSTSDSVHTVKSEIKGQSAFDAVKAGVQSMLSAGGQIALAESTGSMTVTDTPQVMDKVTKYIKTQNAIANRQIAIRADVYEISSDENGDFDPSLSALYTFGGFKLGVADDTFSFSPSRNTAATNHQFSGDSTAAFKMLRTNKNVSQVSSSTIYAQNGEPTPFQQLDEIGYLAEVEIETAESESASNIATLKPGKTSQGYSMTIIPRVTSDGRVMMKFAVDSSRLNSIDSYGLDGGAQIQVPSRSTNKNNQLVTVKSGEPLMIAGIERTSNNATITSPMGRKSWLLGGSQQGGKKKIMTMIVLTPYIMQK
ncbi:hypothetical protein [Pseudomonas sp. CFBP 13719]|uniref:hypothetical protein n=1 Tax=Pseudomonas sp. CFBP 13719 TaxID=2775303 RepID=UPI00177DC3EA|nr:hypothetical protein [Pseudomonas sp. CFBP 13719]MBD8615350.1 hypothetical protein [Pseudomonas putida]MBD8681996.1 hypothetical protein [Pseudomonas sp. CFBP 13719]